MKVVLDTNVLGAATTPSESLHPQALELVRRLQERKDQVFLPSVVVAELGVDYLQRGAIREWDAFLDNLRREEMYRVIPFGLELADKAARLRVGSRLKLPDAVVGVSAISVGADLLVTEDPDLKRLRGKVPVEDVRRALKMLRSS